MNRLFIVLLALLAAANASDSRIIGGLPAEEGQFPYITELLYQDKTHLCGGSLLNSVWVLTAASCIDSYFPEELLIKTGSVYISKGIIYQVSSVDPHIDWDSETGENDIAVIKTAKPILFYPGLVQPIRINQNYIDDEVLVTVAGWGDLSDPTDVSNKLKYIILKSITSKYCQSKYPNLIISPKRICTMESVNSGVCHRDSGGPLVFNGTVVGVVSWGKPCNIGYPYVFTRVSAYTDWISSTIGQF